MPAPKTEATANPTPPPWHIRDEYGMPTIVTDSDTAIAQVIDETDRDWTDAELDANARLIVRAVNSHAALLAALKELADWPRRSADADGKLTNDPLVGLANVRRFARAAIAAAEGAE